MSPTPTWFFRQPRYRQAAICAPFVLVEAVAFFLIARRMDQQIHGVVLPLRAFALAVLVLPLYCFWRAPSTKHDAQIVFAFIAVVFSSVAAAFLMKLPFLLWPGTALLVLPVLAALRRHEMVWR